MVWTREETRPRIRRKKDSGDGTTLDNGPPKQRLARVHPIKVLEDGPSQQFPVVYSISQCIRGWSILAVFW